jgi:hypothetical protein
LHNAEPEKPSKIKPATTQITARALAEFRPVVAIGFVAGAILPAYIAIAEHGPGAFFAAVISACVAGFALNRFRNERLLLDGRTTTIGTVTQWEKSENSGGGYMYSIHYRFLGPDGETCIGQAKSSSELPRRGEALTVSYLPDKPSQNKPLETFWFYRFTYSGFAQWLDP